MAENIIFQPFRGTEEIIRNHPKIDGYVYFAYDTGNIYLDKDGGRYPLGGNSTGIIYANGNESTIVKKYPDNEEDDTYVITAIALENSAVLPQVNSLIVNSDGRFFRVIDVDKIAGTIEATLIAVSGTGSGGGGGSVTPVTADVNFNFGDNAYDFKSFIYGQEAYIEFIPEATLDSYISLHFIITNSNNEQIYEKLFTAIPANELFLFDLGQVASGNNLNMTITLISPNSISHPEGRVKTIRGINIVELGIRKDPAFSTTNIQTGAVQVNYYIDGGANFDLQVYPSVDGELLTDLISPVAVGTTVRNVRIPKQPHGIHTVGIKIGTEMASGIVYTDEITYEIAWVDAEETTPLIWVKEIPGTVIQYENCVINYMVYDPEKANTNSKAEVNLIDSKINEEISTVYPQYSSTSTEWLTWDLTENYHVGENVFTIQCGVASKDIIFNVTTEGSRDLGLVDSGVLKLNLSSAGRSNLESLAKRTTWEYKDPEGNVYTTTFNNFNWYNNGWKDDGDGRGSYLSIANGSSANINFTTIPFNTGNLSYTIELRFRVRNVLEYSTLVTTEPYYYIIDKNGQRSTEGVSINEIKANGYTISTDKDGNWEMDQKNSLKITESEKGVCLKFWDLDTKQGLFVGTQEAYFKTPDDTVSVRYKEDDIINLTITAGYKDLLSIYLNGILSGAVAIGDLGFTPNTTKFEINSKYCDIDIYKLRVYEASGRPLTMPEVIHNYISDEHNLTLYDQNQLTKDEDATALSYKKIIDYNTERLAELNERVSLGLSLSEADYNILTMPYATIEIIDNTTAFKDPNKNLRRPDDDRLPYVKDGGNRYCEINFVNPVADALLDAGLITEEQYYSHSPSYKVIGCDINVQGTSSQGYPRRNFKTKMKSAVNGADAEKLTHNDWGWFYTKGSKAGKKFKKWYMDNVHYATNKFCWKIDYMESSGSYNTGFANLMGNMYENHPLNDYNFDGVDSVGFRTTVYGFPVMVFLKHSTPTDKAKIGTTYEDEIYEYIGRYNLNLDKSSNEYYGFEIDGEQKYINEGWDEEVEQEDGSTSVVHHDHPLIADIAECWELTDNQGTWTSFTFPSDAERYKNTEGRSDYYFGTYDKDSYDSNGNPTAEPKLEVINHFEYRYNNQEDELDACYAYNTSKFPDELGTFGQINLFLRKKYKNLEDLMIWLDSTDRDKATDMPLSEPYGPIVTNIPGKYLLTSDVEIDSNKTYYIFEDNSYIVVSEPSLDKIDTYYELVKTIEGDVSYTSNNGIYYVTYYKDSSEYRLEKFRNEAAKHLNIEYCAVYYVLTELLLCYDSRGKNMMLASWGPQEVGGDYIWYPIFYDIDTQLGLNNIGATLWDYDTDASKDGTFSTSSSVLWVNFADAFNTKIISTYANLRATRLTETNIEGAYLCDPDVFDSYAMRGVRPVIAIGLDEYVKYLKPSVSGFLNTSGDVVPDSYGYVYAINGDRKLSRELLIHNRLNYLDSYWRAGDYATAVVAGSGGGILIRANGNEASDTSDIYLDSEKLSTLPSSAPSNTQLMPYNTGVTAGLDAIPEYTITPFLKQYIFTFNDTIPSGLSRKYQGVPVTAPVSDSVLDAYRVKPHHSQLITRIPGPTYISSLGDLSTKYFDQFEILRAKRLLDLTLGSDIEGYFNNRSMANFILNGSLKDASGKLNENRKTLLQKVILTNMQSLNGPIDLSGSEKLQEFRALGTQITSIIFADGAPLTTVHLPKTVNGLTLTESKNLIKILDSKPLIRKPIAQGSEYYPHESYEGLYIEDITDVDNSEVALNNISGVLVWQNLDNVNSASNLMSINIKGGNFKYESYKLLLKAIAAKEKNASTGIRLRIDLEDIDWCPYTQLSVYDEYDSSNSNRYFEATAHSTFIPYEYNENTWDQLIKNGMLYYYTPNENESLITSLDLLDFFLLDYNDGLASQTRINHYMDRDSSTAHWPHLTGIIYVNNTEENKIDEFKLTETYAAKWPDLTIFVNKVNEANVELYVQLSSDGKENVLKTVRSSSSSTSLQGPGSLVPSKGMHYDFLGWSTDIDGNNMVITYDYDNQQYANLDNELNALSFDTENNILTFYAQFQVHNLKVYYYIGSELIENTPILVPYNTNIIYPDLIPYKDDSNLALEMTYKFIGYSTIENDSWTINSRNLVIMKNPPPTIITNDINLYAQFEETSVYNNVLLNPEFGEPYFKIRQNNNSLLISGSTKWELYLTRNDLKGKITIPKQAKDDNGIVRDIEVFNDRGNESSAYPVPNVTHVFFEPSDQKSNNKISVIGMCCFLSWNNLKYVKLPNTNMSIDVNSFNNIRYLFKDISLDELNDFFSKLVHVGSNAFNRSAETSMVGKTINLPNIVTCGNQAFRQLSPSEVIFGSTNNYVDVNSSWITKLIFRIFENRNNYHTDRYTFYLVNKLSESDANSIFACDSSATISYILQP